LTVVAALIAVDLVMEVPLISAGLYKYWGPQAFSLGGAPVAWAFMNLGCVLSGVALAKLRPLFEGIRVLLATPLVLFCWMAWELGIGWPVYLANSSRVGSGVLYIAAAVTIWSSVLLIVLVGRLAFGQVNALSQMSAVEPRADATPRHERRAGVATTDAMTFGLVRRCLRGVSRIVWNEALLVAQIYAAPYRPEGLPHRENHLGATDV
jgi:hypothetical protein